MTKVPAFDDILSKIEAACTRSVTAFYQKNPLALRLNRVRVSLDEDNINIVAPERHILFMMLEHFASDAELYQSVTSLWASLRPTLPVLVRDIMIDFTMEAYTNQESGSFYKCEGTEVSINLLRTSHPARGIERMQMLSGHFPATYDNRSTWMIMTRDDGKFEDSGSFLMAETQEEAVFVYSALTFADATYATVLDQDEVGDCEDLKRLFFIKQPLWTAADLASMMLSGITAPD